MPIPITKLHAYELRGQLQTNLVNLHRDIFNNAVAHKQMAQAQSPDLPTLQKFVADCVSEYQRRLKWVDDLFRDNDAAAALEKIGFSATDASELTNALKPFVDTLSTAPRGSYAEIVAMCDSILGQVTKKKSLWPE